MRANHPTGRALGLALTMTLTLSLFVPLGTMANEAGCDWQVSQDLVVGLANFVNEDGVSHATEPVPAGCDGAAFTLTGHNPGDDFDICFDDASGNELGCVDDAFGDEAGTIPVGSATARVIYYAGAAGGYTIRTGGNVVLDDPLTGPFDLYFRSEGASEYHVAEQVGANVLSQDAPTKEEPSVAHASWALSGTVVDPRFAWAPEDGVRLEDAQVSVTFSYVSPVDALSPATFYVDLVLDGVVIADNGLGTKPGSATAGEPTLVEVDLGRVSGEGRVLEVRLDVRYADTGAGNAILYDSIDFPSRVEIGANDPDVTPPSAISGLDAVARGPDEVAVTWDEATDDRGLAGYEVFRGTTSTSLTLVGTTNLPAFIDRDLTRATVYHYAVRAVDEAGNAGPLSDPISVVTDDTEPQPAEPRPLTVVAVVDANYNPYHFDFVGHQHPWNTDEDLDNDLNLQTHPSEYIEGYPEDAQAVPITIPTDPDADVGALHEADADAWDAFGPSSGSGDGVDLHWIPGTKIIGAAHYDTGFYGSNSNHGTRSAASAVGNIHGTCDECLVVLISGLGNNGVTWAAQQPWIDVVTNSWESCFPTCLTRSGLYPGGAPEAWKESSEDGQFVVFAAGNGHANAFAVPQFGYTNSQKGTDWVVKVGAVSPSTKQSYSGSTKPVDISSIGSSYPSTGGTTPTGTGFHSGTSNAAPVTAGMIAQVLQDSRELLGDTTPGPEGDGVIASGTPVPCGAAVADCPLGDGVLTRAELRDLVYHNVLPSTSSNGIGTVVPSTQYNYATQGHGVVLGLIDGEEPYQEQLDQMMAAATGDAEDLPRPEGETKWFITDSKCRQRMTGAWSGGYWQGQDITFDPMVDHLAMALDATCGNAPIGWSQV